MGYKYVSKWTCHAHKKHYVVVPTWWDGEPQNSNTAFDIPSIVDVLHDVVQYYKDMTWGLHNVTFEVWDQQVLPGVTPDNADFDNSNTAVRNIVSSDGGYTEFVDYSGIMMVYNLANRDPFSAEGGWAGVNGQ